MGSLKRKLEGEVELRATAADVLHEIVTTRPHHAPNHVSHFIQAVDLHEGEHGKLGSTCVWKYTLGGKALSVKTIVEEIDMEKKSIKYRALEGNMMEEYKTITGKVQVIPKDEQNCIFRWTLEYEKLSPDMPEPSALLDAWLAAAVDIDDQHHGIKK
ncbi:hypothetical protein BVRB_8g196550 [Beta vulgaris subsp. vulgaris]|uniref:MLP-like protein 43 n=1 Tax=Beta vulgaris subsp. vulgaris TaxID=3555 RepID=UPI00053F89F2|nr:MLP-like protein 43 [Beta vulgaris subsp. vulgaris]KMT03097.1 hypothetical protein BVRB_8g196550 [Beta vulgaris subsp. vulgaris]